MTISNYTLKGQDRLGNTKAGIAVGGAVKSGAKIMAITALPFLVIQIPAFIIPDDDREEVIYNANINPSRTKTLK